MSRTKYAIAFALALVMALGAVGVASAAVQTDTGELRNAVAVSGIMTHEQEFQEIADANGDTRASGTPGYDASLDYVKEQLEATGYYDVTVQRFLYDAFRELETPVFQRITPNPRDYVANEEFSRWTTQTPAT